MDEALMLFHMAPAEFWKQIRTTIEDAINEKLNQQTLIPAITSLPEKALLKTSEVCAISQVLKPTLYHRLKRKS